MEKKKEQVNIIEAINADTTRNPYERLAIAIVGQAIKDYRKALSVNNHRKIYELKQFFDSDYCELLKQGLDIDYCVKEVEMERVAMA